MISGLLLAAGQGQRLGFQPKALLRSGRQSFLERAVQQLYLAGVDELIVITGAFQKAVYEELERVQAGLPKSFVREAHNESYGLGLMGSIQCGIRALNEQSQAALITLVDLPRLEAEDFRALLNCERDPQLLWRGSYVGQPCHPVLIPRHYFTEILAEAPRDQGCAFLFERYQQQVRLCRLAHPHGLIDIDRSEDWHAFLTR